MTYFTHRTDSIPDTINKHFVFLGGGGEQDIICIKSSLCHWKYALYGYTKAAWTNHSNGSLKNKSFQ